MSILLLSLQPEEAKAIDRAISAVLKHDETTRLIYPTGSEKRAAMRALKKLHWAKKHSKEVSA